MKQAFLGAFGSLALFALAGCEEAPTTPTTQVYVLVDLSATWHRSERAERNEQVLKEIGHGITLAASEQEPPISVQYRVIGARSLERPPVCDVIFRPSLAPVRSDDEHELRSRSDLEQYLALDCPRYLSGQPAEPLTEIRTAVASVANQPSMGATKRELVVVSDFLEEATAPISLDADLTGFHILLIYRPVDQDLDNPTTLRSRLEAWKAELAERGATVEMLPDTGIKRATIAALLNQGQS